MRECNVIVQVFPTIVLRNKFKKLSKLDLDLGIYYLGCNPYIHVSHHSLLYILWGSLLAINLKNKKTLKAYIPLQDWFFFFFEFFIYPFWLIY